MASKAFLLLTLNIVFFTMVSSTQGHYGGYPGGVSPIPTTPVPSGGAYPTPMTPVPSSSGGGKCPLDALQLGVCANVLNGLVHAVLGDHLRNSKECCSLISGLADVDAALCLCTTLKADVAGLLHLRIPVALTVLLNFCHKAGVPSNYQCSNY